MPHPWLTIIYETTPKVFPFFYITMFTKKKICLAPPKKVVQNDVVNVNIVERDQFAFVEGRGAMTMLMI